MWFYTSRAERQLRRLHLHLHQRRLLHLRLLLPRLRDLARQRGLVQHRRLARKTEGLMSLRLSSGNGMPL
jgi:hypothetical protein